MNISPSASLINFDVESKIGSFFSLNPTLSKNVSIKNLWISLADSAKLMPFVKEIGEKQKDAYLRNKAYFMREDLIEEVMRMLYPCGEYRRIIDALKEFIPQKDISALLISARICKLEDDKINFDEVKEKRKLTDACGGRGLTMYNWLRSGDVFPLDILPFIEGRKNFEDKSLFPELFNTLWESMVGLHPNKIFVNIGMDETNLRDEVIRRVIFKESKKVIIYSRCGRNTISERLAKNLKTSYKFNKKIRWSIKKERYNIGKNEAMKLEISADVRKR